MPLSIIVIPGVSNTTVTTLVAQRIFALALGYEDLNDHDRLRQATPPWHWPVGMTTWRESDVSASETVVMCWRHPAR